MVLRTSFLVSNLLSMPLPDMFLKLSPIFVLSKPKLVAATIEADSIAAQFSAAELIKTKSRMLRVSRSSTRMEQLSTAVVKYHTYTRVQI